MRPLLLLLATLLATLTASAQIPSYVPTDGLVAWYGLESDALDGSGNGNDLTTAGNPQWLNLNGQGYADLDGNGDFFFNNDPSFPVLNEIFVSCWVRIDAFGSGGGSNLKPILSKWYTSGASYGNSFIIYESDNNIRWVSDYGSNTSSTFSYEHNWPTGEWHHIAAYYGDSLKLFIDGSCVSEGINVSDYDNSNSNFRIGDWYTTLNSGYSTLDGGIRAVGIWNRGLSAIEAQALFTEIPPITGCTEEDACNYDDTATIDDGSCIPSGCMDEGACNYNADAECEGEACDYSCCPGPGCCGDGMYWDADAETCVITPPSVTPDTECTLLNLQELAEGYQILLAENAELDSLLSECDDTYDPLGPCSGEDVVTYHGYDYDIVEIGDQCWFAENCRYLPEVSPPTAASYGPVGYVYNYDGDDVNAATQTYEYSVMGAMYNWGATQGWDLCPTGWHIPSEYDFQVLTETAGGVDSAGYYLKSEAHWTSPGGGLDSFGFGALPGGYRSRSYSTFNNFGSSGSYWSFNASGNYQAWALSFSTSDSAPITSVYKVAGLYARCVKD